MSLEISREEELRIQIKIAEDEQITQGLAKSELRLELANLMCPFKVGDIIVNDKGKKFYIDAILGGGEFQDAYNLIGARVKKNGEPYNEKNRIYSWDGPFTLAREGL